MYLNNSTFNFSLIKFYTFQTNIVEIDLKWVLDS